MIITSDIHISSSKGTPKLLGTIEKAALGDVQKTLIVAGDVTCGAKRKEYMKVYSWFEGLISQGVNVVIAPGNHDTSQSILITRIKLSKGFRRFEFLIDMIADQDIVLARRDQFDMISVIGSDVFFATRSTHHRLHDPTRIKRKQFEWAKEVLLGKGLTKENGYRLHLVTHQSLWKLPGDKHGHMHKRRRLIEEFLEPLGFVTSINGHNHGFSSGLRRVKKKLPFEIYHIQAPTASEHKTKGGRCTPGYVIWNPETPGSEEVII